jgi:Ferroportin1 (FPN1)
MRSTTEAAGVSSDNTTATAVTPQPSADVELVHNAENGGPDRSQLPSTIQWRLYVSHFLSTWNSRSFEFGAVLFLAVIFPGTLTPVSVYALVRGASAIIFGPLIGRAIDRRGRLPVVRFSISKSCALRLVRHFALSTVH